MDNNLVNFACIVKPLNVKTRGVSEVLSTSKVISLRESKNFVLPPTYKPKRQGTLIFHWISRN